MILTQTRAHGLRHGRITRRFAMKILTIRRMLGIAVVGVAYVHGKRGGDATLASITDTLRHVWSSVAERLGIDSHPARPVPQRTAPTRVTTPNGLDRPPRPHNA
jgi:hypothetical protein